MSRVDSISTTSPVTYSIDFDALASAQNSDAELHSLLHCKSALQSEQVSIPGYLAQLYCNTSSFKPRPYVPAVIRRKVFDAIHNLSHQGPRATTKLVSQRKKTIRVLTI